MEKKKHAIFGLGKWSSIRDSTTRIDRIFRGTHKGFYTAEHGLVPSLISALGVDIFQVSPTWIDKRVIPPQYRGQDLLELGSDEETVFLYDCWTDTTYRIPLVDLVLNYPLYYNKTTSATLKHLDCHLGSP